MRILSALPPVPKPNDQDKLLQVMLICASIAYPGIGAVLLSSWIARWLRYYHSFKEYYWLIGASILSLAFLWFTLVNTLALVSAIPGLIISGQFRQALLNWGVSWFAGIACAPLGGVAMGGWRELKKTISTGLDAMAERQREALNQQDSHPVQHQQVKPKKASGLPSPITNQLLIGEKHGAWDDWQRSSDDLGFYRRGNWFALDNRVLNTHTLVMGASGEGKTEFLKRLIAETLQNTNRNIVFVDGKGDEKLAQTFRDLVWTYTQGEGLTPVIAPIIRIGYPYPGDKYAAFNISQMRALKVRLGKLVGITEDMFNNSSADSAHYKRRQAALIDLICRHPDGMPKSIEEVAERLMKMVRMTDKKNKKDDDVDELQGYDEMARFAISSMNKDANDLLFAFYEIVREFSEFTSPDGYSFDNSRFILFSIKSGSAGHVGAGTVSFLIEDLKDYLSARIPPDSSTLFIIDEFGEFGSGNIRTILTQGRSAGVGVVLATQSDSGLGDEDTKRLVLGNTRTIVLMSVNEPETIALQAGTVIGYELGMQIEGGQGTGVGTVRAQHQHAINMN